MVVEYEKKRDLACSNFVERSKGVVIWKYSGFKHYLKIV